METIPFYVRIPEKETENDELGIFGRFSSDQRIGLQQVPVEPLKKNLVTVSEAMINVLGSIRHIGNFKLKEVTIQVEISANGGVNLIGTANLGGKGAITLKFME